MLRFYSRAWLNELCASENKEICMWRRSIYGESSVVRTLTPWKRSEMSVVRWVVLSERTARMDGRTEDGRAEATEVCVWCRDEEKGREGESALLPQLTGLEHGGFSLPLLPSKGKRLLISNYNVPTEILARNVYLLPKSIFWSLSILIGLFFLVILFFK